MASQLARQLGPRGGHWGVSYSTYKNMSYRLDKSRSALAEARLKIWQKYRVDAPSMGWCSFDGKQWP